MANDGGAVNLGSAFGVVEVSLDDAQRQIDSQIGNMERGIMSSFGRIGSHVEDLGMSMTKMFSPVTGFVLGGIAAFANFDDVLVEIEARTGATAAQMEIVRQTAIQMGTDTAFSATQASEGMLELLSSGFDLEQTMSALPSVLNLAAAGMLDLGFASDAVTDVLAQFSLGAEDAGMVADALAQASGSSSATIESLIQGFANVGPIAANFGLDVRETAAALSVFSENGIKGAQAGTSLKSMLTNMASDVPKVTEMWESLGVSMFDSEGQMRDFDDVIDDLNVAMDGMSDEERIRTIKTLAGSYGQTGLSALLAADGIDSMLTNMEDATTAAELGAARMNSFKGVINQLKSSLETIMLQVIGPLVENYLQPLAEEVVRLLNVFNAWLTANPELARTLGEVLGILAIIGPVVTAFGIALGLLLNPIGLLIAGLGFAFQRNLFGIRKLLDPLIAGFEMFARILEMGGTRQEAFRLGIKKMIDVLGAGALLDRVIEIGNVVNDVFGVAFNAARDAVERILAPIGGVATVIKFLAANIISFLFPPLGILIKLFSAFKFVTKIFAGGLDNVGKNIKKVFGDAAKSISSFMSNLGDMFSDLSEAFLEWIDDVAPGVITGIISLIGSILQWVRAAVPQLITSFLQWQTAFLGWLGPMIREFLPKLGEFIGSIIEWVLGTGVPLLFQAGIDLAKAFVGWVAEIIPQVLPALGEFLLALGNFIVNDLIPGVAGYALGIGEGLLNGIATGIGSIASILWTDVFQPMLAGLAEWFMSGQALTDLTNVGLAIMGGLLDAMAFAEDAVSTLWTDVFQPMLASLAEWFTSGDALTDLTNVGLAIMGGLLDAMAFSEDIVSVLWTDVFQPMLADLANWFLSGQAGTDLAPIAKNLLDALWWAMTIVPLTLIDVFKPMLADLAEWFLSGQAATDIAPIATAFLDALWWAMTIVPLTLWDIFQPMLTALAEWFTSGQAAADLASVASAILNALRAAFVGFATGVVWLWNNLLKPMLTSLLEYFTSGKAATDLAAIATALLDKFAEALGDVGAWVTDTIVTPIVDTLDGLAALLQPGLDLVKTAFTTVFESIRQTVFGVINGLIGGIESMVNKVIDGINLLVRAYNDTAGSIGGPRIDELSHVEFGRVSGGGGASSGSSGRGSRSGRGSGDAEGTPWTGDIGINTPTGRTTHGQEAVVPARQRGGMSVFPSKSKDGLELEGFGEMLQNIIGGMFSGIDRNLLNSFVGTGNTSQTAMATAGGISGDGVAGGVNFNGDIILELSESVLRDPEMAQKAREFGREFMDGVITNEDIMSRIRGRS